MRDYAVALWGIWRPNRDAYFSASRHRIIVSHECDVGCVEVTLQPDHVWLDRLYLLPQFQRRSIGAVVLRGLVIEAHSFGLPLRLSVLTTNPAQAFYRREGMEERQRDAERILFEAPFHVSALT